MKFKKDIQWYSAFATSYLLMHGVANADAVYVDIEPDITLDNGGEFTELDLNNDGILDFGFMNTDFTSYDYPYGDVHFQRIMVNPFPGNKVAGTYSSSLYSFRYYYPFALNESIPINESLEFHGYFYQGLATRLFFITFSGIDTDPAGNWYPEMLDHYLGINFKDEFGHGHYGWIRCDVKDEGRTLIVKDYAYENRVNGPILTGDTIGDTTFVKEHVINLDSLNIVVETLANISKDLRIYSFNKTVYITNVNLNRDIQVSILNLTGQVVYSGEILNINTSIQLGETPKGNYIVTIQQGDEVISKHVYIN
ncbi:MAG TPA: T9SS type A sorting domain-containing protein [Chitinophagales bacterium]|nr:T9SS type A sorting domain-containing protein [Chitinophagales bacterium]HRG86146.1 T9SS type A sorting domain-containing protein [Chitinophagales bacterium]HRH53486.1 T9SS type A sorting domain-containing protein [Chitinophagales bacterium]